MIGILSLVGGLLIAALGDLTVRVERLPPGCTVLPSDVERADANSFRGGLWAALPITHNPQRSSEAKLIVEVRERLGGSPLVPDAPALTPRDAARFRLRLAEGIEEAYAAVYGDTESQTRILVYGLRFPDARAAAEFWSGARAANNPHVTGVVSGAIVAAVTGPSSACLDAVAAHLQSLR